uniref:EF-hand domain-containing protein n=1 Tax=Strongyloides papillosus TaxID=174720 RepID=A0A0N5B9R7_STREA
MYNKIYVIFLISYQLFIFIFPITDIERRKLHLIVQKGDMNKDYMLDKIEIKNIIKDLIRSVPKYYPGTSPSLDAIEGVHVLSEDVFKKYDKDNDEMLSYRGTLLRKSEAIMFGEVLEKIVINLLHEIAQLPTPYKNFNPLE